MPEETSVFHPELLPSLVPRVERLCALLIEASRDANSLVTLEKANGSGAQDASQGDGGAPAAAPAAPVPSNSSSLPSFLLGATEESLDAAYESSYAPTSARYAGMQVKPTDLQNKIVKEAQALKETLAAAQTAVDDLPGGEMSLDSQEKLIDLLWAQTQRQL